MDKFLMFWACLNFAVSAANLVNLQRLRKEQKEVDEMREELQGYLDNVAEDEA